MKVSEQCAGEIRRLVDRVNGLRRVRLLTGDQIVELVERVLERGGWEFAHGGKSTHSGATTTALAAVVDGRAYLGVATAFSNSPSPKRIHAALSHLALSRTSPETAEKKLREWVASGEALCVANI